MADIYEVGLRIKEIGGDEAVASLDETNRSTKKLETSIRDYNRVAQEAHAQEIRAARERVAAMQQVTAAQAKVETVTKSSVVATQSATLNFGRLREAMTGLAFAGVQTVPGLNQLVSVLGSMAAGSTIMVGVLAGFGALNLIWQTTTKNAREVARAAEEAGKAIDGMGKTAQVVAVENIAKLDENIDRLQKKQSLLGRLGLALGAVPGLGQVGGLLSRGAGKAAEDVEADLRRIAKAEEEITRLNADDRRRAAEKAAAEALDRQRKLLEQIREMWKEVNVEAIGAMASIEAANAAGLIRNGVQTTTRGAAGVIGRGAGGIRFEGEGAITGQVGALSSAADSLFGKIGNSLKSNFGSILSGFVSGGVSTAVNFAVSGISKLVGSLDLFGNRAEAARKAQEAYNRSLDTMLRRQGASETELAQIDAVEAIKARIKGFTEIFASDRAKGLLNQDFGSVQELLDAMAALGPLLGDNGRKLEAWSKLMELAKGDLDALNKELEKQAEAARKAAEEEKKRNAQTLANFSANVAEREARLGGNDTEALKIRIEAQNAAELAAAKDLLDQGIITEDLFKRLAEVLGGELARALKDAEDAAKKAAEEMAKAAASFEQEWLAKFAEQTGDAVGAATIRLMADQQRAIDEANRLGLGDEFIQKIIDYYTKEIEKAQAGGGFGGGLGSGMLTPDADTDIVRSVRSVSEATALSMTGILRLIERNTAQTAANTGGNTSGAGTTYNFYMNPQTTTSAPGMFSRTLTPEQGRTINEALGLETQSERKRKGSASV